MKPRKRCLIADETGVAVVEFAFIAPIFFLMLFGVIAFASIYATMHAVQQLTSEAARASVAGLDDAERGRIVADFINSNVDGYIVLDRAKLKSTAQSVPGQPSNYRVVLVYDNSSSFVYMFRGWLPLPTPQITYASTIVRGGY